MPGTVLVVMEGVGGVQVAIFFSQGRRLNYLTIALISLKDPG